MTAEMDATAPNTTEGSEEYAKEDEEAFKCYIGRVPTKFTEAIVQRILVEKLGQNDDASKDTIVEKVELIYPRDDEGEDGNDYDNNNNRHGDAYRQDRKNGSSPSGKKDTRGDNDKNEEEEKEHRGFGFVVFSTAEFLAKALKLGTVKGGRKTTSKRLHTMYLRPYVPKTHHDDGEADGGGGTGSETNILASSGYDQTSCTVVPDENHGYGRDVCYLWSLKRCPYGNECKFRHVGDGGCLPNASGEDLTPEERRLRNRKKMGKCFVFKKKGSCPKGESCPYSHDFVPDTNKSQGDSSPTKNVARKSNSEKDCINWKTKGKCRKGDACPYKHDPALQKRALAKIADRKRRRDEGAASNGNDKNASQNKKPRKEKQPLSVRIFGLNYDTTEADLRKFVETKAGHPIRSVVFPKFEDSNRSKGYCGVYFASPKAARAAVEACDNAELDGRWLRVQTGKSMELEAWEGLHQKAS